jgi:hypothetical protein
MNRLLLILLFGGTVAMVITAQRAGRVDAARQSERLAAVSADLTREVLAVRSEVDRLRQELDFERHHTDVRQRELSEWDADEARILPPPHAPEIEGLWPANEKWFYLAKEHLPKLGFPFLTADGSLTDEATLLFGLSPGERAELESAIAKSVIAIHEVELARLEPEPVPDWLRRMHPKYESEGFRSPALGEERAAIETDLRQAMKGVVGEHRADLLFQVLDQHLKRDWDDWGRYSRRIVLLTPIAPPRRPMVSVENRGTGIGKYYHPHPDETAPTFERYRGLIEAYKARQSGERH